MRDDGEERGLAGTMPVRVPPRARRVATSHGTAAPPPGGYLPPPSADSAPGVDALLDRLATASTHAELAAIGTLNREQRRAHLFAAETARALHRLLDSTTTEAGASGLDTARRVTRMVDWLAERARGEPALRAACDLAQAVAAELGATDVPPRP